MLQIEKNLENDAAVLALKGRLDTVTAPELERALEEAMRGCKALTLDFSELDYISSAGLRVLLSAQKHMNGQGEMKLVGVGNTVMEIFEVTGFAEILTIERNAD